MPPGIAVRLGGVGSGLGCGVDGYVGGTNVLAYGVRGQTTAGYGGNFNGGTAAILFCFACLYLSTSGGGPLSVDAAASVPNRRRHYRHAQFSGAAE